MFRQSQLFRHSAWDAAPALCGVGILALFLWTFLCFDRLSLWFLVPAFFAIALAYCWNLQCISHNFIHNPFFNNRWLNRGFSILETIVIGVPQVLYHHYHMNHHWGDNDAKDAQGNTKDWSSIYRHSRDDNPEPFWRYVFLSFFRVEVMPVLRVAARQRQLPQLALEGLALAGFWVLMAVVNWHYLVFFYLPSYYIGWTLSYAEGYLEHYGCQPGNEYANSVSSYNRVYNFLWFNNGYHQEHHYDPKTHWTHMEELHQRIKPELMSNHTRTLRGPHLTALFEDWLTQKKNMEQPYRIRTALNARRHSERQRTPVGQWNVRPSFGLANACPDLPGKCLLGVRLRCGRPLRTLLSPTRTSRLQRHPHRA